MKSILAAALALLLGVGSSASIAASPLIQPNSIRTQHEEIVQGLSRLANGEAEMAAAARVILDLMKPHLVKEQELVLPLLAILPSVAEGDITPDMTWAIESADRLKNARDELFAEHAQIMHAVGALALLSEKTNDGATMEFVSRLASHVMSEIEVLEPAAVLVGETVRRHLK